jgi:hypothetical protein
MYVPLDRVTKKSFRTQRGLGIWDKRTQQRKPPRSKFCRGACHRLSISSSRCTHRFVTMSLACWSDPTAKHAYVLSWFSVVITALCCVAGIILYLVCYFWILRSTLAGSFVPQLCSCFNFNTVSGNGISSMLGLWGRQ